MSGVLLSGFDTDFIYGFGAWLWLTVSVFDVFFAWLNKLPNLMSLRNVVTRASRDVFIAGAIFAFVTIADSGFLLIRLPLSDNYGPRAVDLIVWCVFAAFILAPRFGWKLVPVVGFLYGFEELFWNTEFNLSHIGDPYLSYLSTHYWEGFFVLMIVLFIGGYLMARPRIVLPPSRKAVFLFALPLGYFMIDLLAGMPIGASIPQMLAHPLWPYNYVWEFGWQMSFLSIIWAVLRP